MRLFVAVELGEDVQQAAGRAIEQLERRRAQSSPHARVSWVKPGNLHVTVRFIGGAEEDLTRRIIAALAAPIPVPPFELTVAGTGTFPPRRPPRVVWAGLTNGLNPLQSLAREVHARVEQLAPAGDERDYHPHVTLGRVKNPTGLRQAVLLEGLEDTVFGIVQVGAVTLFESRPSPAGATYVALARSRLGQTT